MSRPLTLSIVTATFAAFAIGAIWYSPLLFGDAYSALRGLDAIAAAAAPPLIGMMLTELGRCLVLACVLARLVVLLGITGWMPALRLGALLWIGFPALLLTGSVVHDDVPWRLAAIHAGDWLVKLLVVTAIVATWRRPGVASAR